MNNSKSSDTGQHKALQILDELAKNDSLTQRDISSNLGIALGLVNSYIKNLIAKGYVTVKSIPPRRYGYFLTPKGFAEKTRLSYDLLHDYTRIYREARKNLKKLFNELMGEGVKDVIFAGADEVAEIAYLTLQETDLELLAIVDEEMAGKKFFSRKIGTISDVRTMNFDRIVVASYLKREKLHKALLEQQVANSLIKSIF
jgi:DNA-binding MarR family transcriptional regulator